MVVMTPDEKVDLIMVDLTSIKTSIASIKTDVTWLKRIFLSVPVLGFVGYTAQAAGVL